MIAVKQPLFKLGRVVATPGALEALNGPDRRHGNSWLVMLPAIGAS